MPPKPLITELFNSQSTRSGRDVVFGVRLALVRRPTAGDDGTMESVFNIVLNSVS